MSTTELEQVRENIKKLEKEIREQQEKIHELEEYKKASILVISEMVKMQDKHDTKSRQGWIFKTIGAYLDATKRRHGS